MAEELQVHADLVRSAGQGEAADEGVAGEFAPGFAGVVVVVGSGRLSRGRSCCFGADVWCGIRGLPLLRFSAWVVG